MTVWHRAMTLAWRLHALHEGRAHNNHGQVRLVAHNELEDTP